MRLARRWVVVAALAVVTAAWLYALARAGGNLLSLLDAAGVATTNARVADEPALLVSSRAEQRSSRMAPPADEAALAPPAGELEGRVSRPLPTDELGTADIMRLLEDEIALDTDPAAADELLRAFRDSLDTPE